MKTSLIVIALVVAAAVYVYGYQGQKAIENVRANTVLISGESLSGTSRGTGILLDGTHVLTCRHVMDAGDGVAFLVYTYPLGRVVTAHAEGASHSVDLGVLVLDSSVPFAGGYRFEDAVDGEPVTIIGNALGGMDWFYTRGIVSAHQGGMLVTDAAINPGDSGGPWVDERGAIVAITDWRIGPQDHIPGMAGGISAATIREVLAARERSRNEETMGVIMRAIRSAIRGDK